MGPDINDPSNRINLKSDDLRSSGPNVGTHGSCVRRKETRKSPRASFHNYSGGIYFITICTAEKKHYLGKIVNGNMILSQIGKYCQDQLNDLPRHYKYAEVPLFVVMPNHIHTIICINDRRTHEPCVPTLRTALSVIIGGVKRAVTMYARRNNIEFGWQKRYHDHIIRNSHEGELISDYIQNNIIRWAEDCFY